MGCGCLADHLAAGQHVDWTGDTAGISCRCFPASFDSASHRGILEQRAVFCGADHRRLSFAAAAGVAGAGFAVKFRRVEEFLRPFVLTIKAIPVASFVILVLIWVPSRNLSVVISFLMVFPIIYTNVLDGEKQLDRKLMEMADVFDLSRPVRLRYLYLPQILPYFRTGCSVGLGLCWKAGVAAEVIGIPDNSIGEQLYQAKVYLNTPDLFAWTIVIVLLSFAFEKLFLYLIDRGVSLLERMR